MIPVMQRTKTMRDRHITVRGMRYDVRERHMLLAAGSRGRGIIYVAEHGSWSKSGHTTLAQ